ncbi:hypothetical protein [Actinoplanes sp. NPDC051494]|uniref:hypothetical protein n=1 Tax=Actinoplanes sp. NPDC051494 TaxID=3363907 RepID=UPI003790AA9F
MPYGIVLLPDPGTSAALVALAATIGADAGPLMLVGDQAPPHVSVLHVDGGSEEDLRYWARSHARDFTVKIIGLLFAAVPPGDYYVPEGGYYAGLEVVRRPGLDEFHRETLDWAESAGATPLGAVGTDYRPHVTLGMTARPPRLPDLDTLPSGEFTLSPAIAPLGPYGTFPTLAR